MSQQNTELEGIGKLRGGSLFMILSVLLAAIGILVIISAGVLGGMFSVASGNVGGAIAAGIGLLAGIAIVILIGAIIGLVGILRIRSGFSILKSLGRDVGIGETGTTLYLVGLIIIIIGALLTFVLIGVPILILGEIIALIGGILIGIGFYRVGELYNEGLVKIGGILIIIPIDILNFVGFILAYVGLGRVRPLPTPTQQPSVPQVYQVGQGTIRNDGYAYVTLYSSTPANIISAKIEGANIMSSAINPTVLQIGNNEVAIFFGNIQSLAPNTTYIITLTINIGGNIINISTAAVYQP
ncbi:MAG: DUF973 family protein [Saccharolobus sp.]|uniref:DUF973 family protein n=1 Tax=Saccharolobus shibatae (strain ATCC 51178 / DSM 5389 / JCM 8931 / NBRC 15437 / B12) TaxID=523848 RepID=A0A8F5GTQ2_SACSH|nr:DUF973 family protein [Saccharolobus shibatae]MCH4816321.1 DUF973 family protein [Saccharolobus shibatae]QXJ28607.1 hypothetical protein J5U23_01476 [Saccharolobus shibatae B12]